MSKHALRSLPALPADPALIRAMRARADELWEDLATCGMRLNLTRGKPSPEQLDLTTRMLEWSAADDHFADDGTDCRNYGGLAGLPEMRALFAELLGAPVAQVVAAGNSSLELMHDVLVAAMLSGPGKSAMPWKSLDEVTFLCPVPGYDRHFKICEALGIRMIPVPLHDDGPDMDRVEELAGSDPSVKGMWCVPKYSNPTGAVYGSEVIERLAAMKTAAADFRLFWDNAYAVHHLTDKEVEIDDILAACASAGHADRPYVFASTSKITLAGAGVAAFVSSADNVKWWLERSEARTIGPDKINHLRHVRFFGSAAGVRTLMARHREILAPRFQAVLDVFDQELGAFGVAQWTRPLGGYFISLDVPEGCARRTVELAEELGVVLTPAGATFPYGHDPQDANLRIAPSFLPPSEIVPAARGIAAAVLKAVAERESTASGMDGNP